MNLLFSNSLSTCISCFLHSFSTFFLLTNNSSLNMFNHSIYIKI
jgi:hypothetical protein